MKTIRTIIAAALLTMGSVAMADNYQYLTFTQTDSDTSFSLSQISKITFDTTDMILLMTDGTEQKLPLASLTKMFFSANDLSAIASPSASKSKIQFEDGVLRLDVASGEHVTIYNMKGQEVFTASESVTVSTENFKQGVYIVKIGNVTRKIMSR